MRSSFAIKISKKVIKLYIFCIFLPLPNEIPHYSWLPLTVEWIKLKLDSREINAELYLNSQTRKLEDYSILRKQILKIWIEAFSILKRFARQSLLLSIFHRRGKSCWSWMQSETFQRLVNPWHVSHLNSHLWSSRMSEFKELLWCSFDLSSNCYRNVRFLQKALM